MKQLKLYIMALVGCLMLSACPGGDVPEEPSSYKEHMDGIDIPSEGGSYTYTLNQFSSEIASISSTPSWLTITRAAYTGGSPNINISASANTTEKERKATVTLKDDSNILKLTIVQAGTSGGSTDETSEGGYHNTTSDKPAYSKRK